MQCNLDILLVLYSSHLQFCLQKLKITCWFEIRSLTWQWKNIQFLCFKKLLGYSCSMLWVIIHVHYEHCPTSFTVCVWIWAESIVQYTSEFVLLLLSAVTSSINTNGQIPLAAIKCQKTEPCLIDNVVCFGWFISFSTLLSWFLSLICYSGSWLFGPWCKPKVMWLKNIDCRLWHPPLWKRFDRAKCCENVFHTTVQL